MDLSHAKKKVVAISCNNNIAHIGGIDSICWRFSHCPFYLHFILAGSDYEKR